MDLSPLGKKTAFERGVTRLRALAALSRFY
jgi:hypothetical protein